MSRSQGLMGAGPNPSGGTSGSAGLAISLRLLYPECKVYNREIHEDSRSRYSWNTVPSGTFHCCFRLEPAFGIQPSFSRSPCECRKMYQIRVINLSYTSSRFGYSSKKRRTIERCLVPNMRVTSPSSIL